MDPSRRVCPTCGATNIGSHEACLLCQAMLLPLVDPSAEGSCPQCGEAVPLGGKFCEHCGASLASEPSKDALFCGVLPQLRGSSTRNAPIEVGASRKQACSSACFLLPQRRPRPAGRFARWRDTSTVPVAGAR